MGIDTDYDIDPLSGSETLGEKKETAASRSKSKKAEQYLQKVYKDERKAKSDNEELFSILSKFLKNPLYDEAVPSITLLLKEAFPSRVILGLTAFIYPEAALHISNRLERPEVLVSLKALTRNSSLTPFDENELDPSIRTWMSLWITAWYDFILHHEGSIIMNHKLLNLLEKPLTYEYLLQTSIVVLVFFFRTRNIDISEHTARKYADFILSQMLYQVKGLFDYQFMENSDFLLSDQETTLTAELFFGSEGSSPK